MGWLVHGRAPLGRQGLSSVSGSVPCIGVDGVAKVNYHTQNTAMDLDILHGIAMSLDVGLEDRKSVV